MTDPAQESKQLEKEAQKQEEIAQKSGVKAAIEFFTGVATPFALLNAAKAYMAKKKAERLHKEASEAKAAPTSPTGTTPSKEPTQGAGGALKLLGLFLGLALTIYASFLVMGNLGMNAGMIMLVIAVLFILAIISKMFPGLAKIFSIVFGFIGIGLVGLIALGNLPNGAVFMLIFLIFYVIMAFVIGGAGGGFIVVFLFGIILSAILIYDIAKPDAFEDGPIRNALDNLKNVGTNIKSPEAGIKKGVEGISESYRRNMLIATGDYEAGVEAQQSKPLGVFLEKPGIVSNKVPSDGQIDFFATLKAESFRTKGTETQKIDIDLKCCEFSTTTGCNEEKKGEIRPKDKFQVEEFEQADIDCIMDAKNLGPGPKKITMEAKFKFSTNAFLKSYFMDQETIRSYRREQTDPLDAFKITDKNPSAVYTPGPIKIGMGVGQQPVPIIKDVQYGPLLQITLDKNWMEGELVSINEIKITLPAGLQLSDINLGEGTTIKEQQISCTTPTTNEEKICTITKDILDKSLTSDYLKTLPKTIRIPTKTAGTADTILGNAPLAIRSFKTEITYHYKIHKETDVTITQPMNKTGTTSVR